MQLSDSGVGMLTARSMATYLLNLGLILFRPQALAFPHSLLAIELQLLSMV